MQELVNNGPMYVSFTVYDDFPTFRLECTSELLARLLVVMQLHWLVMAHSMGPTIGRSRTAGMRSGVTMAISSSFVATMSAELRAMPMQATLQQQLRPLSRLFVG